MNSNTVQGSVPNKAFSGKVIIYGCGDLVDDYVVHEDYRNDLGAVWRVVVKEGDRKDGKEGLMLDRLEVFPTRIERFRAMVLDADDGDHTWVRRKIEALSSDLGTVLREGLGEEGQIIIDIDSR